MRGRTGHRATRICCVAATGLLLGVSGGGLWPSAPTQLTVEPGTLARLQTLAGGLHNEIVLCLSGRVRGDSATVVDFEMPRPRESTPMRSSFDPCPVGTLASWHNHPPSYRFDRTSSHFAEASRSQARRLCVLSETDIGTARKLGYPFIVVAVDDNTWCWWSLDEVEHFAVRQIAPGPPAPGRLAEHGGLPAWSSPRAQAADDR